MADEIEVIEWTVIVKRNRIRVAGAEQNLEYTTKLVYEQTVSALDLKAMVLLVANGLP